jgi:GMP synthase-like glutamine amidotransferase
MKRPLIALLQHAPNEGGGVIEEDIRQAGIPLLRIELFSTNEIPQLLATHLVIMGGAMSVNDEKELPWLIQEKKLIREFVKKGAPVLGICLGAQLIAAGGGATVCSCEPELGWSPVSRVSARFDLLPDRFMAFQMHGETFDLPDGAELVCKGDRVAHQALRWGSALGFQFHLELTRKMIQDWTADRPAEEVNVILEESQKYLPQSRHLCRRVTGWFLSSPGRGFSWTRNKG